MYIISSKNILKKTQSEGYAAPTSNTYSFETLQVVIESATQLRSSAMLAGTPGIYRYSGVRSLISLVQLLVRECSLPLILYLDHHEGSDDIFNKIHVGIRSVIIDNSHLPSEDNITRVQEVTTSRHRSDANVEAKLGRLGGREDSLRVGKKDFVYTSPAAAAELVQRTQTDSLTTAIGTMHDLYAHELRLGFVRLEQTHQQVEISLVLYGASGLSEQDVQHCIRHGVCRVNVATGLKIAFADVLEGYFYDNLAANDPCHYMQSAKAAVKEAVIRITNVCGSEGKV